MLLIDTAFDNHSSRFGAAYGQGLWTVYNCPRLLWPELADTRALSTDSPPYRPFSDNETDDAGGVLDDGDELENVRVHLYPDSADPVLRALGRSAPGTVSTASCIYICLSNPNHLESSCLLRRGV